MLIDLVKIDGRMGRARYVRYTLLAMLLMTMGTILLVFPWVMNQVNGVKLVPISLSAAAGLAQIVLGFWIALTSSIRRMRDMGWSALWLCACAVPVEIIAVPALVILSLAMTFVRSVPDDHAVMHTD